MAREPLALVTGAPGWLGNRLVHFLGNDHPDWPEDVEKPTFGGIRCLVLPGADVDRLRELAPDAELVEGDVRDPAAVGRFLTGAEGATVFHLAGVIHPRRIRELYEINTDGTRHVLAAAAAAGARRVVATSSNSPIGASRDPSTLFDEGSPYRPYLAYGQSKKLMEDALNAAAADGGPETVILRPCWFYGPDQPPRQTTFFQMIKDGKAPIVGDGECRRSMSYVDNTALGLLLAAARPEAAGQTYWVADERPYSMNEIVATVESVLEEDFGMEVAHDRMRLPSVASEVAYAVDASLQRAGLYQQKIHVLSEMNKTIACSVQKARDELGYRPSVELREGMRRSVEWCLANGQQI
jgi:nucleoside-diphosphate-sugar epimerase